MHRCSTGWMMKILEVWDKYKYKYPSLSGIFFSHLQSSSASLYKFCISWCHGKLPTVKRLKWPQYIGKWWYTETIYKVHHKLIWKCQKFCNILNRMRKKGGVLFHWVNKSKVLSSNKFSSGLASSPWTLVLKHPGAKYKRDNYE